MYYESHLQPLWGNTILGMQVQETGSGFEQGITFGPLTGAIAHIEYRHKILIGCIRDIRRCYLVNFSEFPDYRPGFLSGQREHTQQARP